MRRFQRYLMLITLSLSLTNCGRPIANPPGYTLTVAPLPLYETKAPAVGFGHQRVFTTLKEGGVVISKHQTAIDLLMPVNANFKPNSSVVNPMLMALLDEIAEFMISQPFSFATIHGYTDNTGTAELNQALSKRRALAVTAYLESQGISSNRLRITALGSALPIVANDKLANRRIEISLTKN